MEIGKKDLWDLTRRIFVPNFSFLWKVNASLFENINYDSLFILMCYYLISSYVYILFYTP